MSTKREEIDKEIHSIQTRIWALQKAETALAMVLTLENSNEGNVVHPFREDIRLMSEAHRIIRLKIDYAHQHIGYLHSKENVNE